MPERDSDIQAGQEGLTIAVAIRAFCYYRVSEGMKDDIIVPSERVSGPAEPFPETLTVRSPTASPPERHGGRARSVPDGAGAGEARLDSLPSMDVDSRVGLDGAPDPDGPETARISALG